jgi:hypothetical protein
MIRLYKIIEQLILEITHISLPNKLTNSGHTVTPYLLVYYTYLLTRSPLMCANKWYFESTPNEKAALSWSSTWYDTKVLATEVFNQRQTVNCSMGSSGPGASIPRPLVSEPKCSSKSNPVSEEKNQLSLISIFVFFCNNLII